MSVHWGGRGLGHSGRKQTLSGPLSAYPALLTAYNANRGVIALVGDSIIAGAGSAASGQYQLSSSIQLIAGLTTAGYNSIDGFLWNGHNFGNIFAYDTRITSPIQGRWVDGGASYYSDTLGAQMTFAQGITYDRVRKGILTSPGEGTYTLTKNGTIFATINQGAGGTDFTVSSYSPASGSQSVVIDHTVAGRVTPIPFVQCYPSATQHLQVCQIGNAGWTTALWKDAVNPFSALNTLVDLDADLYGIMLGTNDVGVPAATYKANLQTMITALVAVGNVVLISPPPAGGTAIANNISAAFKTALAELTTENALAPLIDINTALTPWDFHEYDTDNLHPKAAMHVWMGQYLQANLLRTPYPARPARPVSGSAWGSAGTNVTKSNGDLTAANNTATEWNTIRSAGTKTDRRAFEVKIDLNNGFVGVGVCNSAFALDGYFGASTDAVFLLTDGIIYYAGVGTASGLGALTTGDTVLVDTDPPGNRVRFQKNGGVLTAWQTVALIGGTVYAAATIYDNGTAVTANFSEEAPTGSARWTPL